MSLIGRLFVVFFAFLAACLVAGMIVVGAVLYPEFSDLDTGMIDEISRLVPHLLASAQHDNQDTGIVVVCEGVAGNVAMRLPLLMRMNFASATFGLSLLVDPLATMHGGLLLAREYAA